MKIFVEGYNRPSADGDVHCVATVTEASRLNLGNGGPHLEMMVHDVVSSSGEPFSSLHPVTRALERVPQVRFTYRDGSREIDPLPGDEMDRVLDAYGVEHPPELRGAQVPIIVKTKAEPTVAGYRGLLHFDMERLPGFLDES